MRAAESACFGAFRELFSESFRRAVPASAMTTPDGPQLRGHWLVLQLREAGYLTVSDVAKALGIGTTSLRRREGTLYPRAARIGGIRVYHEADIERLRCRDKVPSTAAGGK